MAAMLMGVRQTRELGESMLGLFVLINFVIVLLAWTVWRYLMLSMELVVAVRDHAPQLWQRLDCPERIHVKSGLPGMHTIKPLFPWLHWIWNPAPFGPMPPRLAPAHGRVRFHLRLALVALVLFVALFAALPSDP